MKNKNMSALWDKYVSTKNTSIERKLNKIHDCIEKFEDMGYDFSKMSRNDAKVLSQIICEGLSHSSAINYCSILNGFIREYEKTMSISVEKVFADKNKKATDLYYSENEFMDDVDKQIDNLVNEKLNKYSQNMDAYRDEALNSILSNACVAILKWYGFTLDEIRLIEMKDVMNQTVKSGNKYRKISDRAWEYIVRYKNMIYVTHFWKGVVKHNLVNTGYLFRKETERKVSNLNEPVSLNGISVLLHRFLKNSSIKKHITLSGAFSTIEEKTTNPVNFIERIKDYIGEDNIKLNIDIKKYWIMYLDGLDK